MKAVAALALLALLAAGCTNPQQDTLRAVYSSDFDTTGPVPVVHGLHLEARVGDGPWGDTLALEAQAPPLAGPAMSSPAPQGGGGDVQQLAPVAAAAEVRIKEATRLGGLTAHWFILDNGTTAPSDLATAQATLAGDGTFQASVTRPGPFLVAVVLTGSSVDGTPQATYEPLRGHLTMTWTATGQVEPVQAMATPAGPAPNPTPRDQMVDRYEADIRPGAHLAATTTFDGQFSGNQGTDVDLGLYQPDGTPATCGSSGGKPVPVIGTAPVPDPSQASETAATDATSGGVWSAQVGAMQDGCDSTTYYYNNAGPVPYKLTLVAS